METSIDPLTREEFVKTRENQRFANAVNRIAYHNRKANNLRKKLMVINRPLLKNNQILMECLGRRSFKTFHKEFLKGKGFLFGVFTHYQEHENKNGFLTCSRACCECSPCMNYLSGPAYNFYLLQLVLIYMGIYPLMVWR